MIEELEEFYGEVPEYVVEAKKEHITILCGHSWEKDSTKPVKIAISDLIEYYKTQAGNITSGCRTLAGFTSDWRGIDELAQECLNWFKFVNMDDLRSLSLKAGMTPKF